MKKELYFIIFSILSISFSVVGKEDLFINKENNALSNETILSDIVEFAVINPIKVDEIAKKDSMSGIKKLTPYIYNEPFNLISPYDSAYLEIKRPTLIWESSLDMMAGIYNYEVYINDTLRCTCLDTSWTVDYDLCKGYNNWYVVSYDSLGNSIQSEEVRTVFIDISHSYIESTTVWSDTKYNGPFNVSTKVTNINGIDKVFLCFKHNSDLQWTSYEMTGSENSWYNANITRTNINDDTVKYYIRVIDTEQMENGTTEPIGAPSNYYWFIANTPNGLSKHDKIPESFSFSLKNSILRDRVIFKLALPENALISLRINDITGRLIEKPLSGMKSAGYYEVTWVTDIGGVYFYSLESPWQMRVGKVVLSGKIKS